MGSAGASESQEDSAEVVPQYVYHDTEGEDGQGMCIHDTPRLCMSV